MARNERRECPREAFVKASIPAGATKHGQLRAIMKHVIMQIDPRTTSRSEIVQLVQDEFSNTAKLAMLPFEAEEEANRMILLMDRWMQFERAQKPVAANPILSKDFSNSFPFSGDIKSCTVHWLIDRGDSVEAIRFKYKSPEYNYRGRTPTTRPNGAPELLMLQRSGEVEAKKLGIDVTKQPVYGAIYYLKHKEDTAHAYAPQFEDKSGNNIISHHFTPNEARTVEMNYAAIAPDASKMCEAAQCYDCLYDDLCHLEFEKRHLMERPPVELKTIDDIVVVKVFCNTCG